MKQQNLNIAGNYSVLMYCNIPKFALQLQILFEVVQIFVIHKRDTTS